MKEFREINDIAEDLGEIWTLDEDQGDETELSFCVTGLSANRPIRSQKEKVVAANLRAVSVVN